VPGRAPRSLSKRIKANQAARSDGNGPDASAIGAASAMRMLVLVRRRGNQFDAVIQELKQPAFRAWGDR